MRRNVYSERIEGGVTHGAAYSIAYYVNAEGFGCPKDEAVIVNIVEYNAKGERINETYGEINR